MDRITYNNAIELAYKIRDEKLIREVDRDMQVIYITGDSGTGKTTLAKSYAQKQKYSVFVTGSSNDPLQGYQGQECVILDDIRGSDWKINDLLKMLDNHTNSLVKSRYSNKLLIDCKLMILTSVQDITDLYHSFQKDSKSEPIQQLMRRCSMLIRLDKKTIKIFGYDESAQKYILIDTRPNNTFYTYHYQKGVDMANKFVDFLDESTKELEKKQEENIRSTFENVQIVD